MSSRQHTISVRGTGKSEAQPDRTRITIQIESVNPQVSQAHDTVARRSKALLDALRQAGVADDELRAERFAVWPHHEYVEHRQVFRGYRGTQAIHVNLHGTERASEITRVIVSQDVRAVPDVHFWVEDRDTPLREARESAFADARQKAEQFAALAGCRLGKVVSISEFSGGWEPFRDSSVRYSRVMSAQASEEVPFEPGPGQVTAQVSVDWELLDDE